MGFSTIQLFTKNGNAYCLHTKSIVALMYLITKPIDNGKYEAIGFDVFVKKKIKTQVINENIYHWCYQIPIEIDYNRWAWTYRIDEREIAFNRFNDITAQYKIFTRIEDFFYIPGAGIRDYIRLMSNG